MTDLFPDAAPAPTFADGKAPDALRTIGEVATALGLRQHVLRYWEEQFPMLKPLKRSGGRRYYRPGDVAMIETIDRLVHREGYTLKGARKALSSRSATPPASIQADAIDPSAQTGATAPAALRIRLTDLRDRLNQALQQA